MAERPSLHTQYLPGISVAESDATASPARGRAMVAELSQKFRLPLQHTWVFWHDRQDPKSHQRSQPTSTTASPAAEDKYAEHLTALHSISDVRQFWEVYNNFDVAALPMRDSVHLFKNGVKPIWEDPRNEKGGAWTFRVPKDKVREFWKEICMMAVGEKLQEAVATNRQSFNDDICGLSLSVRFTSTNISIWNRDADNAPGVEKLLETVIAGLGAELKPKNEQAYYYKKHFEHKDFKGTNSSDAEPPSRSRLREVKLNDGADASAAATGLGDSKHAPKVTVNSPGTSSTDDPMADQA